MREERGVGVDELAEPAPEPFATVGRRRAFKQARVSGRQGLTLDETTSRISRLKGLTLDRPRLELSRLAGWVVYRASPSNIFWASPLDSLLFFFKK